MQTDNPDSNGYTFESEFGNKNSTIFRIKLINKKPIPRLPEGKEFVSTNFSPLGRQREANNHK